MARPRGFATWAPRPETVALVEQVEQVLQEYEKYLPLTVRQVFYRLVGQYGYDKTELAYARLCETLVRARRAGWIPFSSIRDDGTQGGPPQTYADVADFWRKVRDDAEHYSRNRLAGQPVAIELWCEAAGMVPQLQRVAYRYSVPVYSTGGFSSLTVTHEVAARALARDVPTVFLHCGDFDPSGESIFDAQGGDARTFVRQIMGLAETEESPHKGAIELGALMGLDEEQVMELARGEGEAGLRLVRVALTEEQVFDHGLPTAPPKKSDKRSKNWVGETCQLEAMPPELLAETVREAIRGELDIERFNAETDLEEGDELRISDGLDAAEAA